MPKKGEKGFRYNERRKKRKVTDRMREEESDRRQIE